jgi:hypothetical protein
MPEKLSPLSSPKARFLNVPANISNHHALVDSEAFNRALDTALLEYQGMLAQRAVKSPADAGMAGMALVGAQELTYILKGLSEVPKIQPQVRIVDQLPDDTGARRQ